MLDEPIASAFSLLDVAIPHAHFEYRIVRPRYLVADELTRLKLFKHGLNI